jgi:D,D-heptose 1,7-bisphosphate phosphatase
MIPGRSTSSLAEAAGRAQQARAPRRAAFLDRDGTVIVDVGYLSDAEQIQLMPGVIEALHGLRQRGFLLVMVSNQSGVGRGSITPERARAAHQHLVSVLAGHDIVLDDARYCLHAPSDNCDCRKPSPGLILKAARDLGINLSESVLVGDKETDIRAGDAAGIGVTILLGGTGTDKRAASDWHEALRRIDELTASAA